ncbi:hypothetical protein [Actinotalea sp. Marseille-Q4924]|uniref:hypothetical protein n=1 Tax=Actinotalea sp. Marseille-Q4924 TaxID=2866571 RepID=UPI001CE4A5B7|nr:hypothetical protein [Actinotalea sp. Marseille-Q4924]
MPPGVAGIPGRYGTASASRAAALLGTTLGAVVGVVARLRRGKALHPQGLVLRGRLRRYGLTGADATGTWLDEAGDDDVVVRLSRGGGLPRRLPDVVGLAVRAGEVDLLLSSPVGTAPGLRHVPGPRRGHGRAPYGSVLPFLGPRGPVLLLAEPAAARDLPADRDALAAELAARPLVLSLSWASPRSRWRAFGTLEIMAEAPFAVDRSIRFQPLRTPPGLRTYPWVAALRTPAYTASQARSAQPDGAAGPPSTTH